MAQKKPPTKRKHVHLWRYEGYVIWSSERKRSGKHRWACRKCHAEMLSDGIGPTGERYE